MKKINCPKCGKELINLAFDDDVESRFWCDDCLIDIIITEENEEEDEKRHNI